MTTTSQVRDETINRISAIASLSDYTFKNAPMVQIDENEIPSISVYVQSEESESLYHRDPAFSVSFNLTIEIAYKAGVDGQVMEQSWMQALNDAEQAIFDELYTDDTWLDLFDEVTGYSIEREIISEANFLMGISTVTIPCQVTVTYEANR
jgi:hypothetical protein